MLLWARRSVLGGVFAISLLQGSRNTGVHLAWIPGRTIVSTFMSTGLSNDAAMTRSVSTAQASGHCHSPASACSQACSRACSLHQGPGLNHTLPCCCAGSLWQGSQQEQGAKAGRLSFSSHMHQAAHDISGHLRGRSLQMVLAHVLAFLASVGCFAERLQSLVMA